MTGPKRRLDGVTFLTLFLILLFVLPSRLKVAQLGGVGAPAQILSLGGLFWWISYHVARPSETGLGRQPVRLALGGAAVCVLISYVAAMIRPIESSEVSTATLSLISFAGWAGILLVANDGIPNLHRFMDLARRLSTAAGLLAVVGIMQFLTGEILVDRIHIPGLSVVQTLGSLGNRSGFQRPSGTALHAIEFGATLAMLLPIALTLAINDRHRSLTARWLPVAVITFGASVSISRSALVGAVLGVAMLLPAWRPRARLTALVSLPLVGLSLFLIVPGLLGAIAGMFLGLNDDASAQSRVDSYPMAFNLVHQSPLFGRGLGTFLPSYRIFDNQYLLLLMEMGIVGTVAVISLFAVAIHYAHRAGRGRRQDLVGQMAQALVAAVVVGAVSLALYDGFSFPMASSILFLELGLCGALYRLVGEEKSCRAEVTGAGSDASSSVPPASDAEPSTPRLPPMTGDAPVQARRPRWRRTESGT